MNINGDINVFVRQQGSGDVQFKTFEVGFNHKDQKTGIYVDNCFCRLIFAKEAMTEEQEAKFKAGYYYPMHIEGFITTRGYTNKDGKRISEIALYVTKAKCTAAPKEYKKKEKPADQSTILDENGEPLPF